MHKQGSSLENVPLTTNKIDNNALRQGSSLVNVPLTTNKF